jgi:DNA polymerase III alpha subunit
MKNGIRLNGRVLWFDGDSSFEMETLYEYLLSGGKIDGTCFVLEESNEVDQFNEYNPETPITVKTELKTINAEWTIPEAYLKMDVERYIHRKLQKEIEANPQFDDDDVDDRIDRVEVELKMFTKRNMLDILKTTIYIVDTFRANGVVWGTGRGSSCCCYCLYLIELHDVDSVYFDLDLTEFFR